MHITCLLSDVLFLFLFLGFNLVYYSPLYHGNVYQPIFKIRNLLNDPTLCLFNNFFLVYDLYTMYVRGIH